MDMNAVRRDLRQAITALSLRGMRRGGEWCAELLQGLVDEQHFEAVTTSPTLDLVSDQYLCAKAYVDCEIA